MKVHEPLLLDDKVAASKHPFRVRVLNETNYHDQKLIERLFADHDESLDPRGSLGLRSIQRLCQAKQSSLDRANQVSTSIGVFASEDPNSLIGYCPSVIIYRSLLGKQAVIDVPGVIRNGFIARKGLAGSSFARCIDEINSFLYEEMRVVFVEMRLGCGLPTGVASMIQQGQSFIMDLRCESHWLLELGDGVASLDDYLRKQATRNVRRRIIKKARKAAQNGVETKILRRSDFVANNTVWSSLQHGHLDSIKGLNKEFHSTKMAAKVGKQILDLFGAPGIQDEKVLEASLCAHGVCGDESGFCVASFVDNEMIAFMTFEVGETCTHAVYTGKNAERCDPTFAYFALLYAAIEESARLGMKYVDFHATTGSIKRELGCEPAGDMHWVMLSKSFPHLLLWKIIGLLLLPMIRFLEGR